MRFRRLVSFKNNRVLNTSIVVGLSIVVLLIAFCVYITMHTGEQLFIHSKDFSGSSAIEWSDDEESFITLTDDAYMWVNLESPIDIKSLSINFKNHFEKDWVLQVYYDVDNSGMDEGNSIVKKVAANDDRVVLKLDASKVTALRVDWGGDAGRKYSLISLGINEIDIKTYLFLFVITLAFFVAVGLINLELDIEQDVSHEYAYLRVLLKYVSAVILFFVLPLFEENNNGYYMELSRLILCFSIVNFVDYCALAVFRRNVNNVVSDQLRNNITRIGASVIALIYLLLAFLDTRLITVGNSLEVLSGITTILLLLGVCIYSFEYRIIENRLLANFLLLILLSSCVDFYIHGYEIYNAFAFFIFATITYCMNEIKLVKLFFVISVFSFLVTYILAATNVYEYTVSPMSDTIKRGLGYFNPNVTSIHLFTIIILVIYINNGLRRSNLFENLILLIGGIYLTYIAGGRTSILGVVYLLIVVIGAIIYNFVPNTIRKTCEKSSIIPLIISEGILILCFVASIFLSWFYNDSKDSLLIRIIGIFFNTNSFGQRLQKANYAMHHYSPNLFGQIIDSVGEGQGSFIENYYVNSLLNDGVILLACFLVLASIMNIQLWKRKQYFRMLLLTAIPIVAVSECIAINPINNPFTFLAFSKILDRDDLVSSSEREDYKRPLLVAVIVFIWIMLLPGLVDLFKTLFETCDFAATTRVFMVALGVLVCSVFSVIVYSVVVDRWNTGIVTARNKKWYIGLLCFVIISAVSVVVFIADTEKRNRINLQQELPILRLVSENTNGGIYSDRLPLLYNSLVKGIGLSYFHAKDLEYKKNVTVITTAGDDRTDYFTKGFLYMPISEFSAIYTNDQRVVNHLEISGYHFYGFNSHSNKIDMQYMAELNDLVMTDGGGIQLTAGNESLDNGPCIVLSSGKYTVSYELHTDNVPSESDAEMMLVSVSNAWGQNNLGNNVITSGMFDQNGDCTYEIPINGNGSGYEFKATLLSDVNIEVKSIKYAKTPDYDTHIMVDDEWRKIHEEYYDFGGEPFEQNSGYYGADFEYDEIGNISRRIYLDKEMNPVITTSGYASVRLEYNNKKMITKESYFDTADNPIALSKGQASVEYEYDDVGNRIIERYYDVEGTPFLYNSQYYYVKRTYDDKKQIVLEKYFGTDEAPIALSDGAYGYRREYDDSGNVTILEYLGSDGEPVINNFGYAILRREFDDKKQITREDYHDELDNPIAISGGQAAAEYEYDNAGNRIIYRYYDAANAPVLYNGAYWCLEVTYNDLKQNILEKYYGTDGNPIYLSDGAAGYSRGYDEAGNVIVLTYLGADGNAITNAYDYSTKHFTYNAKKQIIREEFFDTEGKPVELSGGQGAVEYDYDENGNRIIDRYYDAAGKSVLYAGEYWYLVRTYNERKQNVREEYYGLDGKLILRSAGYCSLDISYDESGAVSRKVYKDLDGNVVAQE